MRNNWKVTKPENKMKKHKSIIATIAGLITSVCTAMAVIDFNTFDFYNVNDVVKLCVVIMPAIGGYLSTIK